MLNPTYTHDLTNTLQAHGLRPPPQHGEIGAHHRPAALCYICRNDEVLLLRRKQPPFVGLWTAPGGKVRLGESPDDAVRREIWEETGLQIADPSLRLVVLESGPLPLLNWLLYVYRVDSFTGTLRTSDEGPLEWVPKAEIATVGMPDIDLRVSEYVLTHHDPLWLEVTFDEAERTLDLTPTPLRTL